MERLLQMAPTGIVDQALATQLVIESAVFPGYRSVWYQSRFSGTCDTQALLGSLALNSQNLPWKVLDWKILCLLGAVALDILLILALRRSRRTHQPSQSALNIETVDSEKLVDALLESSDDAIIFEDLDGVIRNWNAAAERRFGFTKADAIGHPIAIIFPPDCDDDERIILRRIRAGERIEHYEAVRVSKQGKKVIVSLTISPVRDSSGRIVGAVKIASDITDRKEAQTVLDELSGRLIQAQEEEGARVARELHDDINQRLALVVNGLQELRHAAAECGSRPLSDQTLALWHLTSEIATDVQQLSRRLHPSTLHYLGLEAAARELCQTFSRLHKIQVECVIRDLPTNLDSNTLLCLYRIIQESLRNVAKHSHAQHVTVELEGLATEVRLRVSDDGVGFASPHAVNANRGLGLVSMRERLKSLGGTFAIKSRLSHGAEIEASVPVPVHQAPKPQLLGSMET